MPVPDYVKASVDTVLKISTQEPSGDVLVFLTGYDEVETAVRLLKDFSSDVAKSSVGIINFIFIFQKLLFL